MEHPSDEEVSKSYKQITTNPFSLSFPINPDFKITTVSAKAEQIDDIFYKIFNGLNEERKKVGFKPLTTKRLATAINSNPWLKNSTEEMYNLLTKCQKAGNFKFANFILFSKKKKNENIPD